jgi:hypothetical protein
MYILISEIYSEDASHLYVLEGAAHLGSHTSCTNICDEHTVDMLFTFEDN